MKQPEIPSLYQKRVACRETWLVVILLFTGLMFSIIVPSILLSGSFNTPTTIGILSFVGAIAGTGSASVGLVRRLPHALRATSQFFEMKNSVAYKTHLEEMKRQEQAIKDAEEIIRNFQNPN